MKIKTSKLTGPALDWAVAIADGYEPRVLPITGACAWFQEDKFEWVVDDWNPSEDWDQCGPIIEREGIVIFPASEIFNKFWCAAHYVCGAQSFELDDLCGKPAYVFAESEVMLGPTPLIAAMRCYVASKLGDAVEIPDEVAS